MGKMNWSRPPRLRQGEYEEKYDAGTVLRNGRVVAGQPRGGSLAERAAKAEKEWLAERAASAAKQRARRRKQQKPPSPDELGRLKAIRSQLGLPED